MSARVPQPGRSHPSPSRIGGAVRRPPAWATLALMACLAAAQAADYPLEVLNLHQRPPEDLIPILRPLVGPDGTLVGANNALFVRASPERLADIRRALVELDRPARSLSIQVRQAGGSESSGTGARVRIDESLGGSSDRYANGQGGDPGWRVRVGPGGSGADLGAGRRGASTDLTQEVRALEGHPAFIATGELRPLPYREREHGPWGPRVREGVVYEQALSGFYATARVIGERVSLEIAARAAAPGPTRSGGEVGSRIEGRLGDWIPVAAGTRTDQAQSAGIVYGAQARHASEHRIEVRVVPLPD